MLNTKRLVDFRNLNCLSNFKKPDEKNFDNL